MNLLLALPYCSKDIALLRKCLDWMATLQPEGYRPHSALLAVDSAVSHDEQVELLRKARAMFQSADSIIVNLSANQQGWPQAPNVMFAATARQIAECYKLPWLWFEPDAVPLRSGWLATIADEYAKCPKRFMGSFVPSDGQPNMPPLHLAGCAVYDPQAYTGLQQFTAGAVAFDIASAGYTIPRAANCPAMQHFWGKQDLAPTFTEASVGPENSLHLGIIKPGAVMWHRCKDGTLIDLLLLKTSRPAPVEKSRPRKTAPADLLL